MTSDNSNMDISVQPAQESDLVAIAKLVTATKFALSINRLLWKNWPDEERQHEQTLRAIRGGFENQSSRMLKAVDNQSGELLGYLCYTRQTPLPPKQATDSGPGSDASKEAPKVPDTLNAEVLTTIVGAFDEIAKQTDSIQHYEITGLAVREHYRRRGIGTQLMSVVVDQARAEQIPIAVRSEPASNDFFVKKYGFKETMHVDFDLSKWSFPMSGYGPFRLTGMIWYP